MINWTEEDVKFVCNTMIVPAMEQVMKMVDVSYDSNYKSIEAVVGALDKVNYQHKREISFLQTIIIQYCRLDPQKLQLAREEYFKQYDELNKSNEVCNDE